MNKDSIDKDKIFINILRDFIGNDNKVYDLLENVIIESINSITFDDDRFKICFDFKNKRLIT